MEYNSGHFLTLISQWTHDNEQGMKRKKTEYVYDTQGRMIREERYQEKDGSWEKDIKWEYTYDQEDRIKEEKRCIGTYEGQWTNTGTSVMYRDAMGNIVRKDHLSGNTFQILGTDIFSYDVNVQSVQVMGIQEKLLYRHPWDSPINELSNYSYKLLHKTSLKEEIEYYYSSNTPNK